ncbi:MAG: phosphate regulon transcriptional regulatory protein PhoB [Pelagibacteraceae bacterium]|jgi:two-component system phosphate regulon response regulator PhoB|nr:phosphate regulon transcriptional regulatory protein PhoB [Pelagibacteraceae bacterium]OUV88512.1 MAG: phosphate regulon transcriptional regulatory protein PhoB [Pelagibacteraceae bacterium TMED146]|tara:strand:+ start:476 stop:1162 length:687 start_codon:yes stop_codon:yes gene_type:complete
MSATILVVEDEKSISTLIQYNLEKEGFKVHTSETGEDGFDQIKKSLPDLVLLDWMLPDLSGIDICKQIKKDAKLKSIPVIMLTAKSEEADKIRGFETGADDYVTKPFSTKELILRIQALLKRVKPSLTEDIASFKDIKIDRLARRVYRGDKEIKLGPTEYNLLNFFIKNPMRVYSREQLLNQVWGNEIYVESRTVDVHIRRLRKAINLDNQDDLIRTVRSAGYALDSQ